MCVVVVVIVKCVDSAIVEVVDVRSPMDKYWFNIGRETSLVERWAEMAFGEGFGTLMHVYKDASHPIGCRTCCGQGCIEWRSP